MVELICRSRFPRSLFDLAIAISRKKHADSVAEIVKTGYFLFALSEGGQAEIIKHQSLLYDFVDAVLQ